MFKTGVGNIYTNNWESRSDMISVGDGSLRGGGNKLQDLVWTHAKKVRISNVIHLAVILFLTSLLNLIGTGNIGMDWTRINRDQSLRNPSLQRWRRFGTTCGYVNKQSSLLAVNLHFSLFVQTDFRL